MANAAAVIPLTFRGTDLQEEPIGIFLEIASGLTEWPEVRGVDVTVPYLPGQTPRNRKAHRRRIVLDGEIMGLGDTEAEQRADFADKREQVRALFDNTLDPGVLEATLENGATATINARGLNIIPDQIVPAWAHVSIELESVDPEWVITPAGS